MLLWSYCGPLIGTAKWLLQNQSSWGWRNPQEQLRLICYFLLMSLSLFPKCVQSFQDHFYTLAAGLDWIRNTIRLDVRYRFTPKPKCLAEISVFIHPHWPLLENRSSFVVFVHPDWSPLGSSVSSINMLHVWLQMVHRVFIERILSIWFVTDVLTALRSLMVVHLRTVWVILQVSVGLRGSLVIV